MKHQRLLGQADEWGHRPGVCASQFLFSMACSTGRAGVHSTHLFIESEQESNERNSTGARHELSFWGTPSYLINVRPLIGD
jgi:hypothetical protein